MAHEEAEVRWIDCNIGSRLTMKYPGVIFEQKSTGRSLVHCLGQRRAASRHGAKMVHAADETSSNVIAKSISIGKGRSSYRGWFKSPASQALPQQHGM